MLEATKATKKDLCSEFGDISECDRQCDLVFRYAGIDISNIEIKKVDTSARDLAAQSSKNVRLARCIQENHIELGVKKPSVLMEDVGGKWFTVTLPERCMKEGVGLSHCSLHCTEGNIC
jgi:hypothetical protein